MWKWVHLFLMLLVNHSVLYIEESFLILPELLFDLIVTWQLNNIDIDTPVGKCDQDLISTFLS